MLMNFDQMETTILPRFKGGEGQLSAKMFIDADNKILKGTLAPGCTIGLHAHEDSSEVIYILSGTGKALCDGETERLSPGECHYCPDGYSHTLINDGQEDLVFLAVVPIHKGFSA